MVNGFQAIGWRVVSCFMGASFIHTVLFYYGNSMRASSLLGSHVRVAEPQKRAAKRGNSLVVKAFFPVGKRSR